MFRDRCHGWCAHMGIASMWQCMDELESGLSEILTELLYQTGVPQ